MDLSGKVILIAGASKGTGRTMALMAAKAGADVAVVARSKNKVEMVAAEIMALGRKSVAIVADLSKAKDCRRLVDEAVSYFGRVDSLLYNAAWEHQRAFLKLDADHWDRMMDTNVKGFFLVSQAVAQHLADTKNHGNIVAIASSAGTMGFPNNADYCASKGAMVALVKAMAIDLARYRIRVNALAPGFINGEAVAVADVGSGKEILKKLREFLPSKRFAEQEEVAAAALFLLSDAASYFNGSIVAADGGLTVGNLP